MTSRGIGATWSALIGVLALATVSQLEAQELVFTATGTQDYGLFGTSLDILGDVDADGVGDLVVGNPSASRVWVVSGKDGHTIRVLTPVGNWQADFGRSVAGLGDLNGDAVPDFAVSPGGHAPLVFFSGSDGSWIRSIYDMNVGSDLTNIGDIDDDGFDDLAGAGTTTSNPQARLFLFSGADGEYLGGGPTPPPPPAGTLYAGVAVGGVGEVDDDGVPDIAYLAGGWISLLSGKTRSALWTRSYAGNVSVGAAGDINMDGVPDVAIGLPNLTTPNGEVGAVIIYSGANGAQLRTIHGPSPQGFSASQFGASVSGVGDVNSDGYPDLLVGAPGGENPQGVLTGYAKMFSGLDGSVLYTLYGVGEGDYLGDQVIGGTDLDGDGFLEFAVSSTRGPDSYPYPGPGYVRLFTEVHPTYTTFGSGCPGSAGTPTLSIVELPQVNEWFSIRVDNLAPFQLGVIATGFSDTQWAQAELPLPLELGYLGFPGCHLLVSPDIQSAVGSSLSGTANWGFQMPDLPWLYGFEFYNQAFFLDWDGGRPTVIGSNAGKGKAGS